MFRAERDSRKGVAEMSRRVALIGVLLATCVSGVHGVQLVNPSFEDPLDPNNPIQHLAAGWGMWGGSMNRETGCTVFLTSHDAGDVEQLCRRAIVIDRGKIVLDRPVKELKHRYFKRTAGGEWRVAERIKREVVFRSLNLMDKKFPFKKQFDFIFCRNVMIYFDRPTRDALIGRFAECTAAGGYLFVGHSESLGRGESPYAYLSPAVYRKR